ncbi:vWA domain-containing protein [Phyllobacterium sp. OV277]|uniref:vWA domain-containing protein n=1 Tax=Phyllobacterium sp. OV277 TaxID=1882772 RepID=UPI00088BC1BB|nr:vWA domain-containing protein [Phyllobacterium sp. OV277]SDP06361.1 von Willebrand factor type A domain-containing protein [Phyllobacterium sp. OV277]
MYRSPRLLVTGLAASLAMTALASPALAQSNIKGQRIEVAFVLDTTGSMADLIDGAKRKIWSIANTIIDVNPDADIRMALVAYRDRGDEYVVKSFAMSSDVQGLYGKLIKLEADGGGDTPESVNEALDESVRKLEWTKGGDAKRIVFLVGDAPPHMDYPNGPLYPQVLKRAQDEAITVNTVQAGDDPDTTKVWREIAQLGHGRYIAIPQDGGRITVIETPFDGDIIILQQKIDKTVIPYGSGAKQADLRTKMETKAMAPASVQVDNSRYYSKKGGSKEVVTGGGDLVADVKNGTQKLDALKDAELPENLRGKSKEEKQAVLDQQSQERGKLEEGMAELVKKRDAYVAEQTAKQDKDKGSDSFDMVVKETLRTQLK